jgi:ribosomal protein L24
MKLEHINNHLKYIQRGDYVKAISGHFKGKRGWVSRVNNESACVCWKGVWEHGIWTPLRELKRTRRLKDGGK